MKYQVQLNLIRLDYLISEIKNPNKPEPYFILKNKKYVSNRAYDSFLFVLASHQMMFRNYS